MGNKLFTTVETFGFSGDARWQIRNADFSGGLSRFDVFRNENAWGEFQTTLLGEFNLLNCLAVIIAADAWGVAVDKIVGALASFKNVKRRAEIRGERRGVLVIDDFAHHPTAVRETIDAVRAAYRGRRLWAIFEPRSHTSKRSIFEKEFADALAQADRIVIADVYQPEKISKDQLLSVENVVSQINGFDREPRARVIGDAVEIAACVAREAHPGDVVLVMSNGGFDA